MEFEGVLTYVDLGSGQWVLELENGDRHPLVGDVPDALRGQMVVVTGEQEELLGFGLTDSRPISVERVARK